MDVLDVYLSLLADYLALAQVHVHYVVEVDLVVLLGQDPLFERIVGAVFGTFGAVAGVEGVEVAVEVFDPLLDFGEVEHDVLVFYLAVFEGVEDFPHVDVCIVERYEMFGRYVASELVVFFVQPRDVAEQKLALVVLLVLKPLEKELPLALDYLCRMDVQIFCFGDDLADEDQKVETLVDILDDVFPHDWLLLVRGQLLFGYYGVEGVLEFDFDVVENGHVAELLQRV